MEVGHVMTMLQSIWKNVKMKAAETIYYQYYVCSLVRPDGSKSVELLDRVTGKIQ